MAMFWKKKWTVIQKGIKHFTIRKLRKVFLGRPYCLTGKNALLLRNQRKKSGKASERAIFTWTH